MGVKHDSRFFRFVLRRATKNAITSSADTSQSSCSIYYNILIHSSLYFGIKNVEMQRLLCISVDRDAFGFDALSNDRMFKKKSTPSAIADIRMQR